MQVLQSSWRMNYSGFRGLLAPSKCVVLRVVNVPRVVGQTRFKAVHSRPGARPRTSTGIDAARSAVLAARQSFRKQRGMGGGRSGFVLQFRQVTMIGVLCLVSGVAYIIPAKVTGNEHEEVWLSQRGPFSSKRAMALGPVFACWCSGIFVTFIAIRRPHMIKSFNLTSRPHDMLALPLSILLAFRFQGSYDRWLQSSRELEQVNSKITTLACMCLVLEQHEPVKLAITLHLLGLLDAWCVQAEHNLMRGQLPHPSNDVKNWPAALEHINVHEGADKLVCCLGQLISCIRSAHRLEVFTSEFASEMVALASEVQEHYAQCDVVNNQKTPAPLVVHMRTFLLAFAFTHPFVLLGEVSVVMILPIQMIVSFSLLGIEFCAREMEQPFGDDESDVPVRWLMERPRRNIHAFFEQYAELYNRHHSHAVGEEFNEWPHLAAHMRLLHSRGVLQTTDHPRHGARRFRPGIGWENEKRE